MPSSVFWEVSVIIGRIAAVAVLLTVVLILFGSQLHLKRRLDSVFPDHTFHDLGKTARAGGEQLRSAVGDQVERAHSALEDTPERPDSFGVGASKEEVERVEGKPDLASDDVWEYGASRVYFAGGAVVRWTSSPQRPLKAKSTH